MPMRYALAALALVSLTLLATALPAHRFAVASETSQPGTQPVPKQQPTPIAPPSFFPADLAQRVVRLEADLEATAKAIERVKDRASGLMAQRAELERIDAEAQQLIATLRPRLDAMAAQLKKLGPAPEKDAAPEAPAIANERARLTAIRSEIEGAIKTAELSLVRSRQLVGLVQNLRLALFARDLMLRTGSPFSASTWQGLAAELPRTGRQIANLTRDWWRLASSNMLALMLIIAAGAFVYGGLRLSLPLIRRRMHAGVQGWSAISSRAADAVWTMVTRAVPAVAAAATLYAGLAGSELLTVTVGEFAFAALRAFALFMAVTAAAETVLSPRASDLPLLDVAGAQKLLRLVKAFTALLAADLLLGDIVRMLYLPFEIGVAQAALTSLLFAGLLVAFLRMPLARRDAALLVPPARSRPLWVKVPVAVAALAIVATTLIGYVALGRFIATQVMLVGLTALVMLLAHFAIQRIAGALTDGERPVGRVLGTRFGLDDERTSYFARVLVFLVEAVVLLAAVPLVLLTWGYTRDDILDWLRLGIVGFEIGQFQISLARILLALGLFLGMLFATRLFQRWLDRSVLAPARVDRSIAHSVLMGIGYTGVGLAIIVALSYAGLDFTQLAIVAGALSLGIGFGLQAIFNNFVSGIILLVERPVKVGDWIVVNGQEGFVRRINVRATEIETFDRSSLIIPNSELITGTVMNWTHRNAIGRLVVFVRASYKADPEEVIAILRRVAEGSSSLLRDPAPTVVFEDFGENAMMFSLRAFVPDVILRLSVQTELRLAIAKAFREAGIEIPYAQHDVHLRDLDGVKQAFARAIEARRQEREAEAGVHEADPR